jgi:hypothetical protein
MGMKQERRRRKFEVSFNGEFQRLHRLGWTALDARQFATRYQMILAGALQNVGANLYSSNLGAALGVDWMTYERNLWRSAARQLHHEFTRDEVAEWCAARSAFRATWVQARDLVREAEATGVLPGLVIWRFFGTTWQVVGTEAAERFGPEIAAAMLEDVGAMRDALGRVASSLYPMIANETVDVLLGRLNEVASEADWEDG